jgi:alkylation response protein AidB-like acyl-CoA dehydrogenase
VLRRFCQDKSSSAEVRRLMATQDGYDAAVWAEMATGLGLQGLIIPETYGGLGLGHVELALVMEEMGRRLLCAPYFSTIALATNALLCSSDETANEELLPGIAAGDTMATLALAEDHGRWDLVDIQTRAKMVGGAWLVRGHKTSVTDGLTAGLVLVAARTPHGLSLFAVDGEARGLTRWPLEVLDATRKQARLEFSDTPARLIGQEGAAEPGLRRALDLATVALAAEQVGGAAQCLDMSVEYAQVREQFGRSIGSFQAIKHLCAGMLLEVESARSAAYDAARVAHEAPEDLSLAASLAKITCSEAYMHAAANTLQIHGGIGFTWQHDCHLYFKRAESCSQLLGDPGYHRNRLAALIGLSPAQHV